MISHDAFTSLTSRHRTRWLTATLALVLQVSSLGCQDASESKGTASGTESHFLTVCDTDSECGSLECFAGVCSLACQGDDECSRLSRDSTCGASAQGTSCVLRCDADLDCDGIAAESCVDGFCSGHGAQTDPRAPNSNTVGTPPSSDATPGTSPSSDATPGTSPSSDSSEATDASVFSSQSDGTLSTDGGSSGETPPTALSTDADGGSGAADLSATSDQQADAGMPQGVPSSQPSEDGGTLSADLYACTADADCKLAIRLDVCCPTCMEAYSTAYVEAQECIYAEGEEAPTTCTPSDCGQGCPNAPCASALGAICVEGSCATQVDTTMCASCAATEVCAYRIDFGFQCVPSSCEYDSCHPERCDEIGEDCCDPLPGDGVNYCNGGLECGLAGCQAP